MLGLESVKLLFVMLIVLCFYLLPSLIANGKNKKHTLKIFILNLFFGWTIFGWVGALVWSLDED